jgi:hypothetical protein
MTVPDSDDWTSLPANHPHYPVAQKLLGIEAMLRYRLNAALTENCGPHGRRSAVLDAIQQYIDTIGRIAVLQATDIPSAKATAEGLDKARDIFSGECTSILKPMERYHPGLAQEAQRLLIGRVEYWKAEALRRGLCLNTQATAMTPGSLTGSLAPPTSVLAGNGAPVAAPTSSQLAEAGAQPRRVQDPRLDNEGHVRVAADWETMPIKGSLKLLHEQRDGKAGVLRSPDWRNGYNDKPKIPRCPDALEYYESPDIVKAIRRPYEIGRDLLRQRWLSKARSPVTPSNSFKLLQTLVALVKLLLPICLFL